MLNFAILSKEKDNSNNCGPVECKNAIEEMMNQKNELVFFFKFQSKMEHCIFIENKSKEQITAPITICSF